MTLDLRNLRCAFAAADAGSFRQAAEYLGLPQSSVSRRVQALERRLGFPVFVRSRGGVRLTPAGAAFLKGALIGADQLEFARRYGAAVHGGRCAVIRIGVSSLSTGGRLGDVLRFFKERFPLVSATLTEGAASEICRSVVARDLDVAFVTGTAPISGCGTSELWQEGIFVVLPEAHPLAGRSEVGWSDIRGETFVVSSRGHGGEMEDCLIAMLTSADQRPQIDVHDVSEASILDLVTMGYGVTLAYASAVRPEINGVVFRRVAGEAGSLPLSAVWSLAEVSPPVLGLITIAEAVGRGELPAMLPVSRSAGAATHECPAGPERADRRDRANSRSVPINRSSIGATRRVGSETG